MHPFSQTTVDTDVGPMVVHRGGEAGPWVVCWPALMGDHRSMLLFATALLRRHRVLLIDPPGFAANRAIGGWPAITDQAALAHQILQALGIAQFHWVGQGFGGQVGAAMTARVGYAMHSLTLAGVPLVQPARVALLRRMAAGLVYRFDWGRRAVARGLAEQMAPPGSERTRVYDVMLATQRAANPQVLRQVGPTPASVLQRLLAQARTVNIPKLVIAGRRDTMVLPRDQRTLAEVLGAQYVELDCGPMAFDARPEACVQAFLGFVRAHPRPAAN